MYFIKNETKTLWTGIIQSSPSLIKIIKEYYFILEFPDSYEITQELKETLEKSNLVYELSDYLVQQINTRLLIPGVITMNILSQYINCLQILQIIDPKGLILEIKYQESDLLSILVNLYGSQEAFISEYQNMLAEKMMGTRHFDIDEEIKNLELLKLRCGDYSLQICNIIVKDVKDSKRIDNLIHSYRKPIQPEQKLKNHLLSIDQLHCMFVSKGYWPINYEIEGIPLPTYLEPLFKEYAERFERNKAMRKLIWHTNLGHVNLSLTFDNGEFEFKCLPVHAILIGYFDETRFNQEKGVASDFLSTETGIPQNIIKQKMAFWVHKGIIKEFKKQNMKEYQQNNFLMQKQSQRYNDAENNEAIDGDVNIYFPVKVYEKFRDSENLIYCEDEENEMILRDQTYAGIQKI
ncbi:hypothetical protein IMG5_116450 [Ichthyophthirius multifiliis]|uniref:Cullin family profile domain-containing protein n=1 Tax=Ichthyophthirius multifiliis TaxID=5932 RepID=G0QUD7_ICHMU|nr:hypothetical protein IMG5_116450 [Ichthyophthirius multifiliis]EGR31174.1 hypothetical protein IMG5_116450 [Ichthyophthirius multifiliis]|eukprot:XP_004034660.1 hypothetical protein IMG5_116450 [Ichthyophthirius multifiliis]